MTVLPHANAYPPAHAAEYGPLVAVPEACGLEVIDSEMHVLGPDDATHVTSGGVRTLPAGTTVGC